MSPVFCSGRSVALGLGAFVVDRRSELARLVRVVVEMATSKDKKLRLVQVGVETGDLRKPSMGYQQPMQINPGQLVCSGVALQGVHRAS